MRRSYQTRYNGVELRIRSESPGTSARIRSMKEQLKEGELIYAKNKRNLWLSYRIGISPNILFNRGPVREEK